MMMSSLRDEVIKKLGLERNRLGCNERVSAKMPVNNIKLLKDKHFYAAHAKYASEDACAPVFYNFLLSHYG